jgi:hypothetical protein
MSDLGFTVAQIIDVVAPAFDVSPTEIRSQRRHNRALNARKAVCGLAREYTLRSLPQIGAGLGDRCHTTILTAADRHIELLRDDDDYAERVAACRAVLDGMKSQRVRALLDRTDPVEAARRVLASPRRGPTSVSHQEIVAMASFIIDRISDEPVSDETIEETSNA